MAPESVPWLLAGGVFLASTLQSASGIGFGGVVGPLIMISMRSSAAAQVSIVLSFVIALALAPAMLRRVDMPLLKQLVLGALIGVQLGNAAFAALSLPALEWAAAAITAFNIATIPRWTRWRSAEVPDGAAPWHLCRSQRRGLCRGQREPSGTRDSLTGYNCVYWRARLHPRN